MSIEAFQQHPEISSIQVVIHPESLDLYEETTMAMDTQKLLDPVFGGETRQASVLNGLENLQDLSPSYVLIHDAARPFVSADLISQTLKGLEKFPGAIPALPVNDTVKKIKLGPDNQIKRTLDRETLFLAQTPQAFHYSEILQAHKKGKDIAATDDASLLEAFDIPVTLIPGDPDNIKITTQHDLQKGPAMPQHAIRTGMGFDVHAFEDGDHVILAGVKVKHDKKLKGHSDADVGLHALTDALLGACGMGDIGQMYPPSDNTYKDIDSAILLENTIQLMREQGWDIVNVDLTLICEAPKIGPHRQAMVQRVAEILEIQPDQVSIKATTTEGLGFTGRNEGIAAQAIASVVQN